MLAALHRQRWPEELRFIPHAATWLNQGRWQDDPGAAAPPEPTHAPAATRPTAISQWAELLRAPSSSAPAFDFDATAEEITH